MVYSDTITPRAKCASAERPSGPTHDWVEIKTIADLGKEFCRELEQFFVNYLSLSGEQYKVLGIKGPARARKLARSGMR